MKPNEFLKNKKVLVVGLGRLGGGIAATKWLLKHGANVTVTDLKSRRDLSDSIKKLGIYAKKTSFVLGKHEEKDFLSNDILVVNPDVNLSNPLVMLALENNAQMENELSLFLRFCKNPIVGITGTRGKTTTATWTHHFLKQKFPKTTLTGNTAENPMLEVVDRLDGKSPVVAELSSFQLEALSVASKKLPLSERGPDVAVITNIMRDHLNRHKTMAEYVKAKANIFAYQEPGNRLILADRDRWTPYLLRKNKNSTVTFYDNARLNVRIPKSFSKEQGDHNLMNLRAAAIAAHEMGVSWKSIGRAIKDLPKPRFRQEEVINRKQLAVINDSTATTPDATVVALQRFSKYKRPIILIAGGTDKDLDYRRWAGIVEEVVAPEHILLLKGSATEKMLRDLGSLSKNISVYKSLGSCVRKALKMAVNINNAIVLFSPGATSFEMFKNEFDRGEKFNSLVRQTLKKGR